MMSPVHPETPIIVISILFLYLNTLRNVTFLVNVRCFHINGILSNKIRFPDLTLFGRINIAGCSFKDFFATKIVAPKVHTVAQSNPNIA